MSYYKITDPTVIQAWHAWQAQVAKVWADAQAFADLYPGSTRLVTGDFIQAVHVYGLTFQPRQDTRHWTQPDLKRMGAQFPRRSARIPAGTPKEEREAIKAEHTKIREAFYGRMPKTEAKSSDLLSAIGLDWGTVFMTGLGYFFANETLYLEWNGEPTVVMVEILGSEYKEAQV